jgi:hypothetical protein
MCLLCQVCGVMRVCMCVFSSVWPASCPSIPATRSVALSASPSRYRICGVSELICFAVVHLLVICPFICLLACRWVGVFCSHSPLLPPDSPCTPHPSFISSLFCISFFSLHVPIPHTQGFHSPTRISTQVCNPVRNRKPFLYLPYLTYTTYA